MSIQMPKRKKKRTRVKLCDHRSDIHDHEDASDAVPRAQHCQFKEI